MQLSKYINYNDILHNPIVSILAIFLFDSTFHSVNAKSIERRFQHTVRDEHYCGLVRNSKGALYTPEFINEDELEMALLDDFVPSKEKKDLVIALANYLRPNKLCNSTLFTPDIQMTIDKNCDEICSLCVPGSIALCTLRSPRIRIFGATCHCTYARADDPIKQAAFSIRNEALLIHQPVLLPKD